jgi:hypothetical protein
MLAVEGNGSPMLNTVLISIAILYKPFYIGKKPGLILSAPVLSFLTTVKTYQILPKPVRTYQIL